MKILKWFGKIMVILLCLQWVYVFSYSIIFAQYLEERESLLVNESVRIRENFRSDVESTGTYIMRSYITRIVNDKYSYNMSKVDLENYLKIIMKKEGWEFVEKKNRREINIEILIFRKGEYMASITFLKNSQIRISLEIDDFYSRLNW